MTPCSTSSTSSCFGPGSVRAAQGDQRVAGRMSLEFHDLELLEPPEQRPQRLLRVLLMELEHHRLRPIEHRPALAEDCDLAALDVHLEDVDVVERKSLDEPVDGRGRHG